MGLLQRFKTGLLKSREGFTQHLETLFSFGKLDPQFFEELEETLILGDVGATASSVLVKELADQARQGKVKDREAVKELLISRITRLLDHPEPAPDSSSLPLVILLVGVNGSGKTTTCWLREILFGRRRSINFKSGRSG